MNTNEEKEREAYNKWFDDYVKRHSVPPSYFETWQAGRAALRAESETVAEVRKAFICNHCQCVYADAPVSSCDCMEGDGFIEGTIVIPQTEPKDTGSEN